MTHDRRRRHPLAEKLHALRLKNGKSVAELKATLHMAQLEVEKYWDSDATHASAPMRARGLQLSPLPSLAFLHVPRHGKRHVLLQRALASK